MLTVWKTALLSFPLPQVYKAMQSASTIICERIVCTDDLTELECKAEASWNSSNSATQVANMTCHREGSLNPEEPIISYTTATFLFKKNFLLIIFAECSCILGIVFWSYYHGFEEGFSSACHDKGDLGQHAL